MTYTAHLAGNISRTFKTEWDALEALRVEARRIRDKHIRLSGGRIYRITSDGLSVRVWDPEGWVVSTGYVSQENDGNAS